MQIQYELLKHRQSEYLKAIYETRGKQRIHGKSLLTLNMKSRICCDYRTTILSNSFFHATTLLSICHEKFLK